VNWWLQPLLYGRGAQRAPLSVRENVAVGDVLADVYLPAATPAPIVFLIHGGPIPQGAQIKNIPLFRDYGRLLAGEGFVALLNHPAGEHGFDVVTDDARTRQIIGRTLAFLGLVTSRCA